MMVVGADNKAAYREVTLGALGRRPARRDGGPEARRAHRRQRPAARASRRAGRAARPCAWTRRPPHAERCTRPDASRSTLTADYRFSRRARRRRRSHEPLQVLHRPADLRRRAVGADLPRRPDRAARAADLGISRGRAALGRGARAVSRRQPEGDRRDGGDADRGSDQRRRGHALHEQPGDHRRPDDADRHVQARHRPRQGAAAGAEPRLAGRAAAARGSAPPRRHDGQELARPDHGRASAVAERPLRHDLPAQLRGAERQGPPGAHRRRRPGAAVRRAATIRCASGSIRRRSPSAAFRRATSCARSARRTCRPRPAWSAHRRACRASTCSSRSTRRAACRTRRSSATSSSRPAPTARSRACATSRASSSAPPNTRCARCSTTSRRSAIADLPGAGLERASQISDNVRATMAEIKKNMPEGVDYQIVYDPTQFVRASIEAVVAHAAGGDRAGRAGGDPVPADLARLDHPAAGRAGVDRSARSR